MYPWTWFWAPRIQFPFSGALSQNVDPNTSWFFDSIEPPAGIGDLEKKIFDLSSYGTQLGLITDVLLALPGADAASLTSDAAKKSLARLKQINETIGTIKRAHAQQTSDAAISLLEKLRETNRPEFDRVMARFR